MNSNLNALAVLFSKHHPSEYAYEDLDTESEPHAKSLPHQALDAFAELAVSDSKAKFATAIRLDAVRRKAIVFLAGNQEVHEKTVQHLGGVWKRLKLLADAHLLNLEALTVRKGRTNAIPAKLEIETMRAIYAYSHVVVRRRFDKWWPVLKWVKRRIEKSPEAIFNSAWLTQELHFTSLVYHLGICYRFLEGLPYGPINFDNEPSFDQFDVNMRAAARMARRLLLVPNFCERLAWKCDPKAPPRLRQAIKKLTATQRHLDSLFDLAQSVFYPVFLYDFKIQVINPTKTLPEFIENWPKSSSEWRHLENAVLHRHQANCRSDFQTEEGMPAISLSPNHYIHCECALIQYLDTNTCCAWLTIPYIGLSSRPCEGCSQWIDTYNQLGRNQGYLMRRSSGKWAEDFAVPTLAASKLTARLLTQWQKQYCHRKQKSKGTQTYPELTYPELSNVSAAYYEYWMAASAMDKERKNKTDAALPQCSQEVS